MLRVSGHVPFASMSMGDASKYLTGTSIYPKKILGWYPWRNTLGEAWFLLKLLVPVSNLAVQPGRTAAARDEVLGPTRPSATSEPPAEPRPRCRWPPVARRTAAAAATRTRSPWLPRGGRPARRPWLGRARGVAVPATRPRYKRLDAPFFMGDRVRARVLASGAVDLPVHRQRDATARSNSAAGCARCHCHQPGAPLLPNGLYSRRWALHHKCCSILFFPRQVHGTASGPPLPPTSAAATHPQNTDSSAPNKPTSPSSAMRRRSVSDA